MTSTIITMLKHLQIPLEEVVKATNNFDEEYVIGEGGFGKVYRGQLLVSGEMVNIAARRLHPKHRQQGSVEFLTEISVLSSLKHENIVSLIGFCEENGEKIIVSKKEASKGSLSMYLSDPTLTWIQRLNICVGVARALQYIQNGEGRRGYSVIHRNINSATILLDDNWDAKLSGFEFSIKQSVDRMDRVVISEAIGTKGYMDPEIIKTGGVTHMSDIYSFGVVLCELLCGRKAFIPDPVDVDARFLAPLFRIHYEKLSLDNIIHPDLRHQMNRQSLAWFLRTAYSCLKKDRTKRLKMDDIVVSLQKAFELENYIKKLEHLKIPLSDILLTIHNSSKECIMNNQFNICLYNAEIENFDTENPSIKKQSDQCRTRNKVVIKRYLPRDKDIEEYIEQDLRDGLFFTEIKMLNTCKHPSIVKLLGFCVEGREMILVIEWPSNGYLIDYLQCAAMRNTLTWAKRLKICLDVANALNYIHTEMEDQKTIINRNIRSASIALDESWVAKITDFSISVFLPPNQYDDALYSRHAIGMPGYLDPEYQERGKVKRESDVYSFGVLLFEILCGRSADDPIYLKNNAKGLASVARQCFQDGTLSMLMIDPKLKEESGENNKDSLLKFVKIAYRCIAKTQNERPTMKVVIQELQDALSYQEGQLQPVDMVHIATEVEESMDDYSKDEIQRPNMVQDFDELMNVMVKLALERTNATEGQLQPVDMVHDATEVEESMDDYSKDEIQRPNMVQDFDELMKVMVKLALKWTNATIKKLEYLKIPLGDIMLATDNFSQAYVILDAPHPCYTLYRAELKHFDTESPSITKEKNKSGFFWTCNTVVIKRYLPEEYDTVEKMFFTEIQMLTTCKHPSITKLLGFCVEGSEMILVVEHLSNGYLSEVWHPRDKNARHYLTWAKRLKMCLGVANALNYLHTEMEDQKMIIHHDFRSRNIAVDENWGTKIIDFRNAVFLPPNQYDDALYHSFAYGSDQYMDPEYRKTYKLKRESDVYGFGVILFEFLCGRSAYDPIYLKKTKKGLAHVARRCIREGTLMEMIDPLLKEQRGENSFTLNGGANKDSLEKFVKIAHECIAKTQDQRPTMKVVIKELEEALLFQENKDDLIISLHDIKLATENFHNDNCIGGGGFGKVYRGKVPQGDGFNTVVAKRLDTRLGQGEQQFKAELQILFEYKHKNIITLVGYCDETDAKIILYEYASRGSLDKYLKDARLTWMKRLDICIDVATALAFLHGGDGKQAIVIHRDIKAANILLNDEWNAKLGDFGLSLISAINKETDYAIEHPCGTKGYLDPLYLKSGFLTIESDIYSFGVVLFEILCGRFLPSRFIKESFEKGKHDDLVFEALKEQIVPKALTAFQTIAYRCLHDDREKRPTAKQVLEQLKEALEFQISGSD